MTELVHVYKATKKPSWKRRIAAATSALGVAAVAVAAPLSVNNAANAEVIPLAPGEVMNQQLMAAATANVEFELPELQVAEIPKAEPKVEENNAEGDAATAATGEAADSASAAAAPPAGNPDPGSAQAIARGYVANDQEFNCLVALWNRESGWNVYAHNASSGAYGIPQSLPGNKMASAGADWQTNPDTQIRWGLGYIQGRYGSPCAAWAHSNAVGWY